jgi:hypothetical protein
MKLVLLPLLFILGFYLYEGRDKIIDQYNAAYPSDRAKAQAMAHCAAAEPDFNRLDADDRKHCYRKELGTDPSSPAPTPSAYYAYNPSHLPGNDIRREQANDEFLIHSARAAPAAPVPASLMTATTTVPGASTVPYRAMPQHHTGTGYPVIRAHAKTTANHPHY